MAFLLRCGRNLSTEKKYERLKTTLIATPTFTKHLFHLKRLPKILIAAPQNSIKDYAMKAWIENVRNFEYPKDRIGIFLADNSDTPDYAKELNEKYNIDIVWSPPAERSIISRMAESHNLCRDHALKHGYDFMLHLETDVFPAPDALKELVFSRKPIISALYHIRHGAERNIMAKEFKEFVSVGDNIRGGVYDVAGNACWFADGTIRKVFSAGLGCILIHRSVLDGFLFRVSEKLNLHPDSFFAEDMFMQGKNIYLHTGIFCEHWNLTKWADGESLQPFNLPEAAM